MRSSEHANRPRWKGQHGFFEIWFLVLFDRSGERAWWFRYTVDAPAKGRPEQRQAMLWAAAFDARGERQAVAAKALHPAQAFEPIGEGAGFRIADAELSPGVCKGSARGERHTILWDLTYTPAEDMSVLREPAFVHLLPLATHVAHAHDGIQFSGWVEVDGERQEVHSAPGLQKHLWGGRRVEELFWLYCPSFREDPGARLEATAVRMRQSRWTPQLAPVWLSTSDEELRFYGFPGLLFARVQVEGKGVLGFRASTPTRRIVGKAWCDPRSLVGYAYRDPAGWDVQVAQSDLGQCELELFTRPAPWGRWTSAGKLTSAMGAALEFHSPQAIEGIPYIPWDASGVPRSTP